jgi:hypothetical protein
MLNTGYIRMPNARIMTEPETKIEEAELGRNLERLKGYRKVETTGGDGLER